MANIIKELPEGNYTVGEPKKTVLKELPKGDYSVNQPIKSSGTDYSFTNQEDKFAKVDEIVNNVADIDEGKKNILKDLVRKGVQGEELSNSILTLQGKHPKQNEAEKEVLKLDNPITNFIISASNVAGLKDKYYLDDKGVPQPLKWNERPPSGHDVASTWGTQGESENDNFFTSAAKHIANGFIGAAEGVTKLGESATGLITGEEPITAQALDNAIKQMKFATKSSEKEPIFTGKVEKFSDIFNPDNYDFSGDKVQGAVLQGLESVISFVAGTKGVGALSKAGKLLNVGARGLTGAAAEAALSTSQLATKAQAAAGAYMTVLPSLVDVGKEAGLEGRDLYGFATATAVPVAALESLFGAEGLFVANSLAKQELKNVGRTIIKGIEKDAEGNFTKKGLEDAYKKMTVASISLGERYIPQVAKETLGEGLTEVAQGVTEEGAKQLYDKLSEDPKFNTTAFSPESTKRYVNDFIGGVLGAGLPSAVLAKGKVNAAKQKAQSDNAYDIANKGEEAVKAFKGNIENAVKSGEITEEEGANAITKVNAYSKYNEETANDNLSEEDKKEIFNLSFQITDNKSKIITDKEQLNNMSPIEVAKNKGLEEITKGLQNQINDILLKNRVEQEPVVAAETKEKVSTEEAPQKPLYERFVARETSERPSLEEVTTPQWNKLNDLQKKQVVQEHLKFTPKNEETITLQQGQNNTIIGVLPDGKSIKLAQSAPSLGGETIDFIKRENLPAYTVTGEVNDQGQPLYQYESPVAIKRVEINAFDEKGEPILDESGKQKKKAILPIFNPETGKFIAFQKEERRGKSEYSELEKEQLTKIQNANFLTEEIEPFKAAEQVKKAKEIKVEVPKKKVGVKELLKKAPVKPKETIKEEKVVEKPKNKKVKENIEASKERELSTIELGEFLEKETARQEAEAAGYYQKKTKDKGNVNLEHHERIKKVAEKVQKSFPKVKVVFNSKLNVAGKVSGNKIEINPYFASESTPIHEGAHILLDAIGHDNKVIQAAIKQIKESEEGAKMWERIQKDYSELDERGQENELLAEAIGKEGEGIFDKESDKSKFRQYLEYIFNWLKQKLGLDKNVAKSLAKQIISGISTKKLEGVSEEKFQKNPTISFDEFREQFLGEDINDINDTLKAIDEYLKSGLDEEGNKLSKEDIEGLNDAKEHYKKLEADATAKYQEHLKELDKNIEMAEEDNLDSLSDEQAINLYNELRANITPENRSQLNKVMAIIGMNIFNRQKNFQEQAAKKIGRTFSEERVVNEDLSNAVEVKMKVLSHMTEAFPDLQALSKIWDEAYFNKIKESQQNKRTHEKLALAVIKDTNKKLGIIERAKIGIEQLFFNVSRKYFNFIEGKDGKIITLEEAKKKELSEPQIEYLKFVREQLADRNKTITNPDIYNMDLDVLKIDKEFREAYKTEGLAQAFSSFLGSNDAINNVEIEYTNPNTNKASKASFKDVEKEIIKYGEKGVVEKGKALALLAKYNSRARKRLKQMSKDQVAKMLEEKGISASNYSLDAEGKLVNKFNKQREKGKSYSQDFYKAMSQYIDESAHVKHVSPLLPIINSIEYINRRGIYQNEDVLHAKKPNVVKWMQEWKDLHVFEKPQTISAEIDAAAKFLRFMTSMSTMLFNVPANVMNLAIGVYNTWKQENSKVIGKGLLQLFGKGNRKIKKDYAFGAVNPFVVDLVDKYKIVSNDVQSNPLLGAGGILQKLGFAGQQWGEYIIQSASVMGQMTDEDLNSFEYKKNKHGIDELVVKKGVDEKALEGRINSYINRSSDIQGKYSEKDRRNISNNELGKAVFQFKTWMPDWWKERFGKEYIDRDGNKRSGTFTGLIKDGLSELRKDINDKGTVKGLFENKNFMSNLKGLAAISTLLILANSDDEDKKKKGAVSLLDKALANVLFIFDPESLKFTITNPIASLGTIKKLIDAFDHMITLEENKKGELKIKGDIKNLTPIKKVENIIDYVNEE